MDVALVARDVTGTFTTWYHNVTMIEDIYTQTSNEIPENTTEMAVPRLVFGTAYTQQLPFKFSHYGRSKFRCYFRWAKNILM